MLLSELQNKEIINIQDGECLGNIIDCMFDTNTGNIQKIVIEPKKSNLFQLKSNSYEINYNDIIKIGNDVILIEKK